MANKYLIESAKRKQEIHDRIKASYPPDDIHKYIVEQTQKTADCNSTHQTFDKQSFRLGMANMWIYLFEKGMIKK